jgi:apolipoprotein N-acyltransferase
MAERLRRVRTDQLLDRALAAAAWLAAGLTVAAVGWILSDLLHQGLPHLNWSFLTQEPSDSGRAGGIAPVLVSTLLILAICLVVSVPLALASEAAGGLALDAATVLAIARAHGKAGAPWPLAEAMIDAAPECPAELWAPALASADGTRVVLQANVETRIGYTSTGLRSADALPFTFSIDYTQNFNADALTSSNARCLAINWTGRAEIRNPSNNTC